MAGLNPFLEDKIVVKSAAESKNLVASSNTDAGDGILLEDIAEELIKNKYVLTALELYTEIQERGKDLQRLKNYFSNPSNFDLVVSKDGFSGGLCRTASSSTFDSLDMARLSDDGGIQVDEKVAVLEFELRKANDTIKSLRANLTKTAEQQTSCLQENVTSVDGQKTSTSNGENVAMPIKPLELRALNHLVNEYLLNHGYKLSSITFSDENVEQDFEDWDEVGLNTPKPPDLLALYRDYNKHLIPTSQTSSCSAQTIDVFIQDEEVNIANLKLISELKNEVSILKKENQQLQVELNQLQLDYDAFKNASETAEPPVFESSSREEENQKTIEKQDEPTLAIKQDAVGSQNPEPQVCEPEPGRMPKALWEALLNEMQSTVEDSWLKNEVLSICGEPDEVVLLLGRCLPHIVPTVLLAKRDQLVPLLLATSALHPDLEVRNDLLHIIFNLIKKPDATQRQIILHGCKEYARHVGCHRAEEELLPQFWEQLGHKYPERRQLVAEACGTIAPYLRAEMRGSLLVSILHQMKQEEKIESVICSVVQSLALIYAFVDDDDGKYMQAFDIFRSFLNASSSSVREVSCTCLLPSIAMWSTHRGTLHSHFFNQLLKTVENTASEKKEDSSIQEILPLMYLLPYLFAACLREINPDDINHEELSENERHLDIKRELENPSVIMGGESQYSVRISYFDSIVSNSKISKETPVLMWTTHQMVPRILNILIPFNPELVEGLTSIAELIDLFCVLFGKPYIEHKVVPQFVNIFNNSSEHLSTCLLPIYVASILPILKDDRTKINEFLLESIVKLSDAQFSVENVKVALLLLRCKPHYHDVIIQTVWSAVIHESALVRASAAYLLVTMTTNDVDPRVVSTRVLPALITLSTDEQTNVQIATVSSFCFVMTNPTVGVDLVERVITQLTEVVASSVENSYDEHSLDGTLLGLHSLRKALIDLVTDVGAVLHPKFRDEFILPHLVAIAASNNRNPDSIKRSAVAIAMLEAYTCLSCCFITSSLLQGSVLPALKCLSTDMESLHPEKLNDVNSLISEVERKLDQGSMTPDSSPQPPRLSLDGAHQSGHVISGADDAKRKIRNTFDQLKMKKPLSPNLLSWRKQTK